MNYYQFRENIKDYSELYDWIENNIKFGIKDGEFKDFYTNWFLLTPEQVYDDKIALVYDLVEFIKDILRYKKYDVETYMIVQAVGNSYNLHPFILIKENEKLIVVETYFHKLKGIKEYYNFNEIIQDYKNNMNLRNDYTKVIKYDLNVYRITAQQLMLTVLTNGETLSID